MGRFFNWFGQKLQQGFVAGLEKTIDLLSPIIEPAGAASFDAIINGLERGFQNGYTPKNPDLDRFDSPLGDAGEVESVTIDSTDLSVAQQIETRDAVVAATIGYLDASDLQSADVIDAQGYVIDPDAFYGPENRDTILENWSDGVVAWADARFDVIRVIEDEKPGLFGGFEANVALMQNIQTEEYFISVGGTNSISDALSDVSLVFTETTGASEAAISAIIADFFETDIPDGAVVNLAGQSLGGAEVLLQYRNDPDAFDDVYAIQSVGIGGADGTYYDRFVWDGKGDPNITEINGDDPGTDFNDLVTYWGHIGAGQTYFVDNIENIADSSVFAYDLELIDAHLLTNLWASLPGGDRPDLPLDLPSDDPEMMLAGSTFTDAFDLA